ncbi:class I SAM-dependent methyltransferase [Bacteriovorax sp. PP10]|uniref:Class I SAM-dependent methyltransferase n=1 Tax=Bacteriovorax antarcticus TaxID=3088717 RepID=A0ABU5VSA9_9BACT|nr:class I SAM-dependent methyltransferase [Bacteriovorax sp. PP10]MEA9355938.1 class I SAM-dependent methyltransferase [Bacteriovorax sp. PP10]
MSTLILEKDNLSLDENLEGAFGPFFLSIDDIRPHLLNPDLGENDLVRLIQEMSMKFTKRRDQIGDYVLDDDHVSAYTALYLTTNIPKLHFLFSKLSPETLADISARTFIDIGCGPGTFSLGISLLNEAPPKEIICVDSSRTMLNQAEKMIKGFFSKANVQTHLKYRETNRESVLFYGHSINEMGIDRVQDQIMTIDPEYVIWIEPGTSELFSDLKRLRTTVLDAYDVLYPCPSNAGCPNSWCHQVLRTSHDPSVERLSQLVSLDRKILPMTAHVYKRKSNRAPSNEATIIRYITETKFSFEYEVCMFENDKNKNVVVEIQKKQLDKKLEKKFKNLNVGEKLNFTVEKIVGDKYRVKLNSVT